MIWKWAHYSTFGIATGNTTFREQLTQYSQILTILTHTLTYKQFSCGDPCIYITLYSISVSVTTFSNLLFSIYLFVSHPNCITLSL